MELEESIMIGLVNTYVSRYIIPFYYDCEGNGYANVVEKFRKKTGKDTYDTFCM